MRLKSCTVILPCRTTLILLLFASSAINVNSQAVEEKSSLIDNDMVHLPDSEETAEYHPPTHRAHRRRGLLRAQTTPAPETSESDDQTKYPIDELDRELARKFEALKDKFKSTKANEEIEKLHQVYLEVRKRWTNRQRAIEKRTSSEEEDLRLASTKQIFETWQSISHELNRPRVYGVALAPSFVDLEEADNFSDISFTDDFQKTIEDTTTASTPEDDFVTEASPEVTTRAVFVPKLSKPQKTAKGPNANFPTLVPKMPTEKWKLGPQMGADSATNDLDALLADDFQNIREKLPTPTVSLLTTRTTRSTRTQAPLHTVPTKASTTTAVPTTTTTRTTTTPRTTRTTTTPRPTTTLRTTTTARPTPVTTTRPQLTTTGPKPTTTAPRTRITVAPIVPDYDEQKMIQGILGSFEEHAKTAVPERPQLPDPSEVEPSPETSSSFFHPQLPGVSHFPRPSSAGETFDSNDMKSLSRPLSEEQRLSRPVWSPEQVIDSRQLMEEVLPSPNPSAFLSTVHPPAPESFPTLVTRSQEEEIGLKEVSPSAWPSANFPRSTGWTVPSSSPSTSSHPPKTTSTLDPQSADDIFNDISRNFAPPLRIGPPPQPVPIRNQRLNVLSKSADETELNEALKALPGLGRDPFPSIPNHFNQLPLSLLSGPPRAHLKPKPVEPTFPMVESIVTPERKDPSIPSRIPGARNPLWWTPEPKYMSEVTPLISNARQIYNTHYKENVRQRVGLLVNTELVEPSGHDSFEEAKTRLLNVERETIAKLKAARQNHFDEQFSTDNEIENSSERERTDSLVEHPLKTRPSISPIRSRNRSFGPRHRILPAAAAAPRWVPEPPQVVTTEAPEERTKKTKRAEDNGEQDEVKEANDSEPEQVLATRTTPPPPEVSTTSEVERREIEVTASDVPETTKTEANKIVHSHATDDKEDLSVEKTQVDEATNELADLAKNLGLKELASTLKGKDEPTLEQISTLSESEIDERLEHNRKTLQQLEWLSKLAEKNFELGSEIEQQQVQLHAGKQKRRKKKTRFGHNMVPITHQPADWLSTTAEPDVQELEHALTTINLLGEDEEKPKYRSIALVPEKLVTDKDGELDAKTQWNPEYRSVAIGNSEETTTGSVDEKKNFFLPMKMMKPKVAKTRHLKKHKRKRRKNSAKNLHKQILVKKFVPSEIATPWTDKVAETLKEDESRETEVDEKKTQRFTVRGISNHLPPAKRADKELWTSAETTKTFTPPLTEDVTDLGRWDETKDPTVPAPPYVRGRNLKHRSEKNENEWRPSRFSHPQRGVAGVPQLEIQSKLSEDMTSIDELIQLLKADMAVTELPFIDRTTEGRCSTFECDFENGDTCKYETSIESLRKLLLFRRRRAKRQAQAPFFTERAWDNWKGNHADTLERIDRAPNFGFNNTRFAGVFLGSREIATMSLPVPFRSAFSVRFRAFEATRDMRLRVCCDDFCPFSTEVGIKRGHRRWLKHTVMCPRETSLLVFECVNSGKRRGSCGVDDIFLDDPGTCRPFFTGPNDR